MTPAPHLSLTLLRWLAPEGQAGLSRVTPARWAPPVPSWRSEESAAKEAARGDWAPATASAFLQRACLPVMLQDCIKQ